MAERAPQPEKNEKKDNVFKWVALGFVALLGIDLFRK